MPLMRVPQDIFDKISTIMERRGYKSLGYTLRVLLGNLEPSDIPEAGAFDIKIGITLTTEPFIKKRTVIKTRGEE